MGQPEETCWSIIRGASAGRDEAITRFVSLYGPIVQSYLAARWKHSSLKDHLDDAMQEVFLACFKDGGVLVKAQDDRVQAFRPFLLGAARNISRQFEAGQRRRGAIEAQPATDFDAEAEDERLSRAFDRAWAAAIVKEAAQRQAERARSMGPEAERRVELLRLRFSDGLKIRDIAARWDADLKATHHQFDKARAEFEDALADVIRRHYPGEALSVRKELERLMDLVAE